MIDLPKELLEVLVLRAVLGGVFLGCFYDLLRAFRMVCGIRYDKKLQNLSKKRSILVYTVVFVTDVVFWLMAAILSIAILYTVGGGRFRGMVYPLMAGGFLLYYLTLGKLALKVNYAVICFLKRLMRWVFGILRWFFKMILRPIIFLYHLTIGRIIGKIKERIAARRNARKIEAVQEVAVPLDEGGGKEEFVYVDGRKGYRKEGRISFGGFDR